MIDNLGSFLYIPANRAEFIAKASQRHANHIILDMEDSVQDKEKAAARANLKQSIQLLKSSGQSVFVRINNDLEQTVLDLQALQQSPVDGIVVSDCQSAHWIRKIDAFFNHQQKLIAILESLTAYEQIDDICRASDNLLAIICGAEDLSLELGVSADSDIIRDFRKQTLLAAKKARISALGLAGSISDFKDLEHFRLIATEAKSWGFAGATCIHPTQVAIINEVYQLSEQDILDAKEIIRLYEASHGSCQYKGKMIDKPIYEKALRYIQAILP